MPRSLKLYITGVVTASALALGVATLVFPADQRIALDIPNISGLAAADQATFELLLGLVFWTVVELVASALPVKLPHGTYQAVGLAPLVAAMTLGGPAVGGWVAAIGSTETREIRGEVPWYGTLVNHAGIVLPIVIGGMVRVAIASILSPSGETSVTVDFASSVAGAM